MNVVLKEVECLKCGGKIQKKERQMFGEWVWENLVGVLSGRTDNTSVCQTASLSGPPIYRTPRASPLCVYSPLQVQMQVLEIPQPDLDSCPSCPVNPSAPNQPLAWPTESGQASGPSQALDSTVPDVPRHIACAEVPGLVEEESKDSVGTSEQCPVTISMQTMTQMSMVKLAWPTSPIFVHRPWTDSDVMDTAVMLLLPDDNGARFGIKFIAFCSSIFNSSTPEY